MYGKNWRATYFWPYIIGAGIVLLVVGLVLRSRDIAVLGISVGVLGPILEVVYYWFWEGVRRMIEKLLFKRDGK